MSKSKKRCKSCYNKEDKTCCNRTRGGWGKLLLYHIVFLFVIIGMLVIVILNINRDFRENSEEPAIKKLIFVDDIGPGATMVPYVDQAPLIHFKPNSSGYETYVNSIDRYMKKQKDRCRFMFQTTGRMCSFNVTEFGPCGSSEYGYKENKPCMFLKLNKIPTWSPEKYGSRSKVPKATGTSIDHTRNVVHVSCRGHHPNDRDILLRIKYYPEPLFSEKHFPLPKGVSTNPVIAIQIEKINPGTISTLICNMYAKNIKNFDTKMYFYLDQA